MKFEKEFSSQMVPEWQQAYVNYKYLKTLIQDINRFKRKTNPLGDGMTTTTLYRTFSGRKRHGVPGGGDACGQISSSTVVDMEEGITTAPIHVSSTASERYETTFLMTEEKGGEYELVFFRRLDDEFNRVEKFYREKVEEVVKEAAMLNKQMDALIAFRLKIEEERPAEMSRLVSPAELTEYTPRMAYEVDGEENRQIIWRLLGGISSAMAVVFCTYWDLVYDWGLLNRTSKNPWLRDELLLPYKEVYFMAMILNVVLRFAWMQTVLDFKFESMHTLTVIALVASLEIIRRGIWNFFRLENEHLNNVGKYRACKTVSLPFNYDEDQ